jgi:hypothetical protein
MKVDFEKFVDDDEIIFSPNDVDFEAFAVTDHNPTSDPSISPGNIMNRTMPNGSFPPSSATQFDHVALQEQSHEAQSKAGTFLKVKNKRRKNKRKCQDSSPSEPTQASKITSYSDVVKSMNKAPFSDFSRPIPISSSELKGHFPWSY